MEEDPSDEYDLKKNSGPGGKDHYRNRLMEYVLKYLKSYGTVTKSYNVPDGPGTWSNRKRIRMEQCVIGKDIPPCLRFSMNKKERWELEDSFGVDMLGELFDLHDGMDVVILQRVFLGRYPDCGLRSMRWLEDSKIGVIHCLETFENERPKYHMRTATRRGHCYSSIIPKKTVDENNNVPINDGKVTVAYNFMKAPDHYLNFDRKRYNCNYYRSPRHRYNKRVEMKKLEQNKIQHKEFLSEEDSEDSLNFEFEDDMGQVELPMSKFYNFSEYLVEKFEIVNLKKKKKKNQVGTN